MLLTGATRLEEVVQHVSSVLRYSNVVCDRYNVSRNDVRQIVCMYDRY